MQKKSQKWGALALVALALVFAGCENTTGGVSSEEVQQAIGNMPFVNTDPGLRTLDDALAYVSKWVWRYDVDETDQRLYFNNYYVTFTPTRFSFSTNLIGIPAGSYPYTLVKDGDGYILKIADWTLGVPGDSLTSIARIVYDPEKLTLVFTNPTDDDEYDWSVDGDTFLPDLTEYYASSSFVSASYTYLENNTPVTTANKVGTISFIGGNLVTSDASEVFTATAVNNKPNGIAWAVVGKDRKLIGGTFTDMGNLSVDPEKPLVTIGTQKFAQRIGLCGFICSYYEVDCCPYINGNWVAVDASNNVLTGSDAAYFTIQAGAGWMKAKKTADDDSALETGVYGAGLAGIGFDKNYPAYGIVVDDKLMIYDQATNQPLLTFDDLASVDSQGEGITATTPNPRIITFKPAGKTTTIRLKKL
jgi:predicted small secreted protein